PQTASPFPDPTLFRSARPREATADSGERRERRVEVRPATGHEPRCAHVIDAEQREPRAGLPDHEPTVPKDPRAAPLERRHGRVEDRKSTRLNSSHVKI